MSTICDIKISSHLNDLGGKIWNSSIRWTKKHAVFVELMDDAGRTGVGECWCFDAAPDALVAFIRTEVLPDFLGHNLADVLELSNRMRKKATLTARHGILSSALSGFDIAVWDLQAKQADLALWKYLNGAGTGTVPLYASGGLYGEGKDLPELANEMKGFSDDGFGLVKMKVGGAPLIEDIARVQAVIDALPTNAQIIIDGVYSYDADTALRVYEALPDGRVVAFQSPTPAADLKGMKHLSRAGVPVMATEAEYREELHQKLIEECEIAFLQTAPVACGGITAVRSLSKMAAGTATKLSLEVSSTAVALMAACHLAAADDRIAHVEYHTVHQVFFDQLALDRSKNLSGRATLQNLAGLGISLTNQSRNFRTRSRIQNRTAQSGNFVNNLTKENKK